MNRLRLLIKLIRSLVDRNDYSMEISCVIAYGSTGGKYIAVPLEIKKPFKFSSTLPVANTVLIPAGLLTAQIL